MNSATDMDGARNNAIAQMDWLARLAHDLRGPITPMRYAVQMLQSDRLPAGRGPELLKTLDRQIDVLMQVIDELTDMLKIGGDQYSLQLQSYDLAAIVEDGVGRAARLTGESGKDPGAVSIRPSAEPVLVVADEVRLAQLIAHLLGNLGIDGAGGERFWIEYGQRDGRALIRFCDSERGIYRNAGIDYLVTGNPPSDPGVLGMSHIIHREIAMRHDAVLTLEHALEDRIGGLQLSLPLAA